MFDFNELHRKCEELQNIYNMDESVVLCDCGEVCLQMLFDWYEAEEKDYLDKPKYDLLTKDVFDCQTCGKSVEFKYVRK